MIQSIQRKPLTATLLLYDEMHNIKNPDKVYIYMLQDLRLYVDEFMLIKLGQLDQYIINYYIIF